MTKQNKSNCNDHTRSCSGQKSLSKVNCQSEGFTLLELLVYISILSVVMLAVVGIFIAIGRGQNQVEVRSEVNSNLRFATEKIAQDLRAASAVATPATPGGTTANNLVMTVSGTTVEYCVASNQLRRQTVTACNASSETVTSNKVTVATPTFTRLENSTGAPLNKTVISIAIDLTITSLQPAGENYFTANKKTTVSLK